MKAFVRVARGAGRVLLVLISSTATGLIIGTAVHRLAGNRMAPWIVGRASGVFAYLALVLLVLMGQLLAGRTHVPWLRQHTPALIRAHALVAMIAAAALAVHVVVLATDRWAGVGWWGTALPMGSHYRPAGVTLGLAAAWVAVIAGTTAALAGRLPRRMWWPLHKVAAVAVVLAWTHGVVTGADTTALLTMYLSTGALVLLAATWRYLASRPERIEAM